MEEEVGERDVLVDDREEQGRLPLGVQHIDVLGLVAEPISPHHGHLVCAGGLHQNVVFHQELVASQSLAHVSVDRCQSLFLLVHLTTHYLLRQRHLLLRVETDLLLQPSDPLFVSLLRNDLEPSPLAAASDEGLHLLLVRSLKGLD